MRNQEIQIVGSGLVGPLTAIFLSRAGADVCLHERRADVRLGGPETGRSINLAINARGYKALREVGLENDVRRIAIPMRGRMLHDRAGHTQFVSYGQGQHEAIHSVSRGALNILLLNAAEQAGASLEFNRKCVDYDPGQRILTFENPVDGSSEAVKADVTLAADGAFSTVRRALQTRIPKFNYSQAFLPASYKELQIPAGAGGSFLMEQNALHIWPRGDYMLIALPNEDGSFTCTLFAPDEGENGFDSLETGEDVRAFFMLNFPDAMELMPRLTEDFFKNPQGSLVTIKCSPWNFEGHACLIGDAAHAIVPFSGQGANTGFEDARVLAEIIAEAGENPDWNKIFNQFSGLRQPDTDAIADKSVANFEEMRNTTADPKFQLKKDIGFALEKRHPGIFIPVYSMITHHWEIRQSEAIARGSIQDGILEELAANIKTIEQVDWTKADRLVRERLKPLEGLELHV